MINNIWINIPGFSKYEINRESRQIRSYCRGVEPRILKPCNNALILKADNGEKYTGSLKRFLYSAEKNIDPREISRKYCIVETASGRIELIDRNTFQERIRERLRKKTSVSNIQEEYLNAIQFCTIVLQAYRTGDFSMVITEIESRKAKVTEYIIRHRIAVQPERVREVWEAVLDVALNCIIKKRTYIVNLTGYLNNIARSYAAQKKKLEKITVSLDAGFYSLQKYQ